MATPTWDELSQNTTASVAPTWDELSQNMPPPVEQEQETSFGKGFVEGEGWSQQAGDLLGAVTGIRPELTYRDEDGYGLGYKSTEEIYGEGFADASFDERRKMITDERARKIEEDYGDVEGSTFGNVAGMLFDPTTALPVGATYKGMAAIGGAIGGTYSVTDQLLNKGSVDPVEAGLHSIAGATGSCWWVCVQ
jgi:hypothetical protein